MITDQVINYIKDQLVRGISRDKIKSNLLAAGWIPDDVNQAFSFAEPRGESAALKIAPAFAVQDPVEKEIPVDKSSITKDEEPFKPILKSDPQPAVANTFSMPQTQPANPIQAAQPMTQPSTVQPSPIESTASPMMQGVSTSMLSARPQVETTKEFNFGDDGVIKKPKASAVLKSLAIFLAIVLIVGNAYLWVFAFPALNKVSSTNEVAQMPQVVEELDNTQQGREEVVIPEEETTSNATLTNEDNKLKVPVEVLQNSAATYFAKNNSYGSKAVTLTSCATAGGVFTDSLVRKNLGDIAALSNTDPKCSLGSDDPKKIRMTSYLVYIPMNNGGYCADSTGAALMVSQEPKTTFCASAV